MYPDTTGSGRERDPGGAVGVRNHYTARGWKGCHKEFHYFSSGIEKVDCAYCNFFSRHHKPLNNLGSFQGRSFPFSLRSLPRVQGRGAQSPWLKETLTHRNTPCHRRCHLLLLRLLPPVLPSALFPHSILYHFISRPLLLLLLPPLQPLSLPLAWFFLYFSAFLLASPPPSPFSPLLRLVSCFLFSLLSPCHHCPF